MPQFNADDVVRISPIKGPWMIIESCDERTAVCLWFDKNDACHRQTFATEFLEVRNPSPAAFPALLAHAATLLGAPESPDCGCIVSLRAAIGRVSNKSIPISLDRECPRY